MTAPRVRACVVSYRSGKAALRACRSALAAGAEVVLFDNAPGDGTVEAVAAALPEVEIRGARRNLGFAAGSNRAAAGARTDHLLFLNPDAVLDEGALEVLVTYLDGDPGAAIAGPALRFPDGRLQRSVRRDPTPAAVLHQFTIFRHLRVFRAAYRRYRAPAVPRDRPVSVPVLMGSVLLVRRPVFLSLGGFDERYRMFYEEADLCRRAREAGHRVVYVPAAGAVHAGGRSVSRAPASLGAVRMVSALRYIARFHPGAGGALFRAAFLLGFPLGAMFDLVRDLLYTLAYSLRTGRRRKAARKLRRALISARLLTADLFRVAAG